MSRALSLTAWALALCAPATTFAQESPFTVHGEALFTATPGTLTENAIGRPSVVWDAANAEYVMYFETRLAERYYDVESYPSCPDGVWGIARATSADGLDWSLDAEPVLVPDPDSFWSCAIAHPNVIFDGETWHLFFKSEQGHGACERAGAELPWGCDRYTGFGYAMSQDGEDWVFGDMPILTEAQFGPDVLALGYPSVTVVDDVWHMIVAKQFASDHRVSMLMASSEDDGRTWWVDPTPVFGPGSLPWIDDQVYNPALLCEDGGDDPRMTLFFAGADFEAGHADRVSAGFGKATSHDGYDWHVSADSPYYVWEIAEDGEPDWRHWTAMRAGDDYVVWFTERLPDENGVLRPSMRVAYTSPEWDTDTISARVCPAINEDDRPSVVDDVDHDGNVDRPGADTPTPGVDPSCTETVTTKRLGCGAGTVETRDCAWLLLPLLPFALRRRRS